MISKISHQQNNPNFKGVIKILENNTNSRTYYNRISEIMRTEGALVIDAKYLVVSKDKDVEVIDKLSAWGMNYQYINKGLSELSGRDLLEKLNNFC